MSARPQVRSRPALAPLACAVPALNAAVLLIILGFTALPVPFAAGRPCRGADRALLAALALVAWAGPVRADQTQVWLAGTVTAGIAHEGNVRLWLDTQLRSRSSSDEVDVSVIRPGIGIRLAPGVEAYAGYARVTTHRPGRDVLEDRIWQQIGYPLGRLGPVSFSGRNRLEQRMRTNAGQTGWRFRQSFRATAPTGLGSLALVASNETFIGLNDTRWGQRSGLDQNRGFIGVSMSPARFARIEAGYLALRINRGPGPDDRRDNVQISTTLTF